MRCRPGIKPIFSGQKKKIVTVNCDQNQMFSKNSNTDSSNLNVEEWSDDRSSNDFKLDSKKA